MINVKKIASSLHTLERKVLPLVQEHAYVKDLILASGLKDVEVNRALQWLSGKCIVEVQTEAKEVVSLDRNGRRYVKEGLPEKVFLQAIVDKSVPVSRLMVKTHLDKEEVNVCLGVLRRKSAILLVKEKELHVKITEQGKELLREVTPEELFLRREFPVLVEKLNNQDQLVLRELRKRKDIVKVDKVKEMQARLTDVGRELIASGVRDESVIDQLTPQVLKSNAWMDKEFRRFDMRLGVPRVFGGKRQAYRSFLDEVRRKLVSLGFTEMQSPLVEAEFWDMDALFMPQFHSARDIHDAYYVQEPSAGQLPMKLLQRVRAVHESGGHTSSKGWKYEFDVEKSQRLILRSQTTAASARMLASSEIKIPGRYFAISRCFRPDVIDATHNADFNQTEGIVVEEGLKLRHLFGLLKMFAEEFAETDQIKIVPGYFPFTEPSAELFAKHPDLGWVELGGAGIFRPEVVEPLLGKRVPVLAWGLGVDRIGMFKLGIKDIRSLFSHDLSFLREAKIV